MVHSDLLKFWELSEEASVYLLSSFKTIRNAMQLIN